MAYELGLEYGRVGVEGSVRRCLHPIPCDDQNGPHMVLLPWHNTHRADIAKALQDITVRALLVVPFDPETMTSQTGGSIQMHDWLTLFRTKITDMFAKLDTGVRVMSVMEVCGTAGSMTDSAPWVMISGPKDTNVIAIGISERCTEITSSSKTLLVMECTVHIPVGDIRTMFEAECDMFEKENKTTGTKRKRPTACAADVVMRMTNCASRGARARLYMIAKLFGFGVAVDQTSNSFAMLGVKFLPPQLVVQYEITLPPAMAVAVHPNESDFDPRYCFVTIDNNVRAMHTRGQETRLMILQNASDPGSADMRVRCAFHLKDHYGTLVCTRRPPSRRVLATHPHEDEVVAFLQSFAEDAESEELKDYNRGDSTTTVIGHMSKIVIMQAVQ